MTKSITSKHQFFFFNIKTQSASCWLWQDGQVQQVHQSSTVKPVVCVCEGVLACVQGRISCMFGLKMIFYCVLHTYLCQTCLTGSLWHCALYTLIKISPLCPCSTVKIYILVPVFSPLAVQNLLIYDHYVPLQFLVYVHVTTVVYIHNSRIIHPLIIYHCPHFNAHFISNFLAWLIYRLSLLIHNPDSIKLVQLSPCLQR